MTDPLVDDAVVKDLEALVDGWLSVPLAAQRLGMDVVRVRQLLRERKLVAVRRGENHALYLPAAFVAAPGATEGLGDGKVLKGLPGTLSVLADNGYSDAEAIRWLFTPDDTLPGAPVQALAGDRGTEVKRRAQALGF